MTRVIIVEDQGTLSTIFAAIFKRYGIETERYADGKSALRRLQDVVPDMLILDMNLPEMTGVDVFRQMRQDPRHDATRVIIVTASPHLAEPIKDQVEMILPKPVHLDQIKALVPLITPDADKP